MHQLVCPAPGAASSLRPMARPLPSRRRNPAVRAAVLAALVHFSLPARLKAILDGVGEVVAAFHPDTAVIEKVFVSTNPQSTLLLGQARGAAICALVAAGLPVHEYTALQVKQAVAGHGKAHKSAVQEMVRRLLGLDGTPGTDSADALAVAICHTNHTGVQAAAGGQLARMGLKLRGGRLVD